MANYEKSAELRDLGRRVIKENEDLRWINEQRVRIGYLTCDHEKKLAGGRLVCGDCRKVSDVYRAYTPYDFLITFYEPNIQGFTDEQREILMYHELLHVGIEPSGKLYVVPHDVEEFYPIISQWGMDWAEGGR